MKIVFATDKNFKKLPQFEGKKIKSFQEAIKLCNTSGYCFIVENPRMGYKSVNNKDGTVYIQRRYSDEY